MGALTGPAAAPAPHQRYPVRTEEDAGAARRAAGLMAATAGVNRGDAEIAAAELAASIVRHTAGDGYLLCQGGQGWLELIAADHGSGLGSGLASVRRLTTTSDCWSSPAGTVVLARFGDPGRYWPHLARWGAVNVPLGGTGESGDGWLVTASGKQLAALVADGLGHGPAAAAASAAAVSALAARPATDPGEFVQRAHQAMRGTRGGVLGIVIIDPSAGELAYAGVGNIAAWVLNGRKASGLLSREGTAGTQERPPQPYVSRLPWPPGAVLVMASDGIRTLRDLGSYEGLWAHDPSVAAAVLSRDHNRGTDDACVLVVRDIRTGAS